MATVINNKFEIGDIVYLKTDPDQLMRMVFAFRVYKHGEILYDVICGTISSPHYEFEISKEKNFVNAL